VGKEAEIVAILNSQHRGSYVPLSKRDTFAPQRPPARPIRMREGNRRSCSATPIMESEPQVSGHEHSNRPQVPEHYPITNLNV
jgi:hypothetical protein